MSDTAPIVKRRRGNPRPVSYPRVCYFRPHEADADVLERYCAVTRRKASIVLRQLLATWAQQPTIRAIAAQAVFSEDAPEEQEGEGAYG